MALGTAAVLGAAGINSATSGGTSAGGSSNASTSSSRTYGNAATNQAITSAATANAAANAAWEKAAAYNAEQARIQREWQEKMSNTVYQRTVKDMIAAGINPILAANMGLGTASVSSGATATMGNPMSYMANTYPESQSASQSSGSSWNESVSGLAYLADIFKNMVDGINSSNNISIAIEGLKDLGKSSSETYNNYINKEESGKYSDYRNTVKQNNKNQVKGNKWLEVLNGLQLKATGIQP